MAKYLSTVGGKRVVVDSSAKATTTKATTGGYEVIRGGQGYSTTTLQPGDVVTKKIGGGAGTGSTTTGGYEVIRGGQGYSTTTLQKGDIVVKSVGRGGGTGTAQQAQAKQQAIAMQQQQRQQQPQPKPIQQFTGKVQESFKGTPQQTTYYIHGKETGRTYQEGGKTYAETKQPSTFVFKQPQREEQVKFTKEGAETTTNINQDVSSTINEGMQEQNQFYYRSFPSSTGIKYYKTTAEGNITTQFTPAEVKEYGLTTTNFLEPVDTTRQTGFYGTLNNWLRDLGRTHSSLSGKSLRNEITIPESVGLFSVGAGQVIIGQVAGTKELFTHPITTIKGMPAGIKREGAIIGASLKSSTPEYAFGRIGGYYATGKGIEYIGKGVVKGVDYARTMKTIEIPMEDVVAPEYIVGQTYPAIAKGQTAGQLLQEFKMPVKQYGVTQLKGFTASPKPLSAVTEAGTGSSELPGLYQAPKLSPQFLRITQAEEPAFTLNPFETLRPSATIIKPESFELIKGLKYSQRNLEPLGKAKSFFLNKAQLGKSYVPFVKTEKEAIIPAGTPLTLTDKRFSFKFEGRKIPIYEFEIGDIAKVEKAGKVYSTKEVSSMSSYRVGKSGVYSPYDVLKIPKSSVSGYKSSITSYSAPVSSSVVPSSYKSSYVSPSKSYVKPSRSNINSYISRTFGSSSIGYGGSSRSYGYYGKGYYGGGSYRYSPTPPQPIITTPRFIHAFEYPTSKKGYGGFSVFVRRRGVFRPVGYSTSWEKAFNIGRELTQKGLSQSFKVRGTGFAPAEQKAPKGWYPKYEKKEGLIFIEQPKTKINTGMEKSLLRLARGMKVKGGKRRR